MKRLLAIATLLLIPFIFAGCDSVERNVINKLSQSQIEQKITDFIRTEYDDEVIINFLDKEDLYVSTAWFDGPILYEYVHDAETYRYDVSPVKYPELHAILTYTDAYVAVSDDDTIFYEDAISTNYADLVKDYRLFLQFGSIVKSYEPDAITLQANSSDNFIAVIKTTDFFELTDIHNAVYEFQNLVFDQSYIGTCLYFLDADIDVDKLMSAELIANVLDYEKNTVNAFGFDNFERFALIRREHIDDCYEFVETLGNIESEWKLLPDDADEVDLNKWYYMKHAYDDYEHIILLDSLEPNRSDVSIAAIGTY